MRVRLVLLILFVTCPATAESKDNSIALSSLERSFWIHASLGAHWKKGYWGKDFAPTPPPSQCQVREAARLLVDSYAANRLYLIYHGETSLEDARRIFTWWRKACPEPVELVPTLVLTMYDQAQTRVFSSAQVQELSNFFQSEINKKLIAIFDVHPRRDQGSGMKVLADRYPDGLIRVGLQPGEALETPFVAAVEDTWSGLCHGTDNQRDWLQPGFGAETLSNWVKDRNGGGKPIAWDLVVVAWDYTATERGGYPGYDDARKNMPLPKGRNRLGLKVITEDADADVLAGFSSDLSILHANSRVRDGVGGSFYETLKRGEQYAGYYADPFREITEIYRSLSRRR